MSDGLAAVLANSQVLILRETAWTHRLRTALGVARDELLPHILETFALDTSKKIKEVLCC